MTHSIFTGVTQSGKTTLARYMARSASRKGRRVIVYDPLGSETKGGDWGETAEVHENLEEFLDVVYLADTRDAELFIDEAHHVFAHDDKSHLWLLTQGRHYGFNVHPITQRPTKIHPDARTSCAGAYVFRLAHSDLKSLGLDYGFSNLHSEKLDKGDFLVLNSGSSNYLRGNVFELPL